MRVHFCQVSLQRMRVAYLLGCIPENGCVSPVAGARGRSAQVARQRFSHQVCEIGSHNVGLPSCCNWSYKGQLSVQPLQNAKMGQEQNSGL